MTPYTDCKSIVGVLRFDDGTVLTLQSICQDRKVIMKGSVWSQNV